MGENFPAVNVTEDYMCVCNKYNQRNRGPGKSLRDNDWRGRERKDYDVI